MGELEGDVYDGGGFGGLHELELGARGEVGQTEGERDVDLLLVVSGVERESVSP